MLLIGRYSNTTSFVDTLKVDKVIAVARRGPVEVKFTRKEFEYIAANLDIPTLYAEFARITPIIKDVKQDLDAAKDFILSALKKAHEPTSNTRFLFDFLSSPKEILGDKNGKVTGLEVEDTTLIPHNGDTKAKRLGTTRVLDVDTVVFCIGDKVDEFFGLPLSWNEYAKNPNPRFPIDGLSYEAYNPDTETVIPDVFLAGWAREASSGLVGSARKDGTHGANALLSFLNTLEPLPQINLDELYNRLDKLEKPYITKKMWRKLEDIEAEIAKTQQIPSFKFGSNKEMLDVLGLKPEYAD